jgi:hypothetical protein
VEGLADVVDPADAQCRPVRVDRLDGRRLVVAEHREVAGPTQAPQHAGSVFWRRKGRLHPAPRHRVGDLQAALVELGDRGVEIRHLGADVVQPRTAALLLEPVRQRSAIAGRREHDPRLPRAARHREPHPADAGRGVVPHVRAPEAEQALQQRELLVEVGGRHRDVVDPVDLQHLLAPQLGCGSIQS